MQFTKSDTDSKVYVRDCGLTTGVGFLHQHTGREDAILILDAIPRTFELIIGNEPAPEDFDLPRGEVVALCEYKPKGGRWAQVGFIERTTKEHFLRVVLCCVPFERRMRVVGGSR